MQKTHSDNPKTGNRAKLLLSDGFSTKRVGLISFSGGETSAFMLQWLLKNKSDEYDFLDISVLTHLVKRTGKIKKE